MRDIATPHSRGGGNGQDCRGLRFVVNKISLGDGPGFLSIGRAAWLCVLVPLADSVLKLLLVTNRGAGSRKK